MSAPKHGAPSCDCPKMLPCSYDVISFGPMCAARYLPIGWEKMTVKQIGIHLHSQVVLRPVLEPRPGWEIWYLEKPTAPAIVAPPDMLMGDVPYPYFYNQGESPNFISETKRD